MSGRCTPWFHSTMQIPMGAAIYPPGLMLRKRGRVHERIQILLRIVDAINQVFYYKKEVYYLNTGVH